MPAFDGLALAHAVLELGLDIPMIVYSGSFDRGAAKCCIAGGATEVRKQGGSDPGPVAGH
jgi:hypothetical protein